MQKNLLKSTGKILLHQTLIRQQEMIFLREYYNMRLVTNVSLVNKYITYTYDYFKPTRNLGLSHDYLYKRVN